MALLRKDVRIAFYAAASLGAVGLVYVGVLLFGGSEEPDDALPELTAQASARDVLPVTQDQPVEPLPEPRVPTRVEPTLAASQLVEVGEEDDWVPDVFVTQTPVEPVRDRDLVLPFSLPPEPTTDRDDAFADAIEHVIAEGELLSDLAERYYGDRAKWDLIQQANPQLDPRRMKIGDVLIIPTESATTTPVDPLVHVVRPGESLSSIAADRLGRSALWETIFELNRGVIGDNPAALKVGMELRLPR
jgi:LysM repeat protein